MPSLRAFLVLLGVLALAVAITGSAGAQTPRVLAVEFENDVNPVTQDYLTGAIDRAEDDGYAAVILLVDTPGGLDSSMRAIIKREPDAAEEFVRRGANMGATEALEQNVIDVIADDIPSLLEDIDGMRTQPKGLVLHTSGAQIDTIEMSFWKQILDTIIDPNLILLMMSLGVLGITVEIFNPGLIFPGTVGAISLIIGLFGLQVLPVSWAGLLLLLLAAGFFVAE